MMNNKQKKPIGLIIALVVLLFAMLALVLRVVLFIDYNNLSGHMYDDIENISTPLDEIEDSIEQERQEYYEITN